MGKSRGRLHKIIGHILAITAIFIVVIVFGGAYYLVIAPNMVPKPIVEKPVLPEDGLKTIAEGGTVIEAEHINYLLNEAGGYKLKKPIGTGSYPIMEVWVTDSEDMFYGYVDRHEIETKKGNARDEDITIKGDQETIYNILNSDNVLDSLKEAKENGKITVELKKDMKVLAAKGYLSIYDSIK
ncbi:hypothetical protein KY358_01115 [Candidatus Woesearchaeota archaeon]|nr:hypothetical protein [Candidatus Woesearchaeota archaeon]